MKIKIAIYFFTNLDATEPFIFGQVKTNHKKRGLTLRI